MRMSGHRHRGMLKSSGKCAERLLSVHISLVPNILIGALHYQRFDYMSVFHKRFCRLSYYLFQKVTVVLQGEICFIKSNN